MLADPDAALARLASIDALALLKRAEKAREGGARTDAIVSALLRDSLRGASAAQPVARRKESITPPSLVARSAVEPAQAAPSQAPVRSAPKDEASEPAAPAGREPPVLDDSLVVALTIAAGRSFEASQNDVALGRGEGGRRGRDACIAWLRNKGVGDGAIAERFPGVVAAEAAARAAEARKIMSAAYYRFDARMAAALHPPPKRGST
jgi:hypothetical protein